MIDAPTLKVLQETFRRESASLLHYMSDAYPWTSVEETEALEKLGRLVREERDAVAALSQHMFRHKVPPPPLLSYPTSFTSLNFVAFDYLVPLLIQEETKSISLLESAALPLSAGPGRDLLAKLLDLKRKNLDALRQLRPSDPRTVMA